MKPIRQALRSFVLLSNVILTFFLSVFTSDVTGQCAQSDQSTLQCETAQLVCLYQMCNASQPVPLNCCNGWCGPNTAVHNPQFYAFIAAEETVTFSIEITFCDSGNGMQGAIIDACPWDNSNVVACDPGTAPNDIMILEASGLIPGNMYWLLMDGSAGATCEYVITQADGIVLDYELEELDSIQTSANLTSVCPGSDSLIVVTSQVSGTEQGFMWVTSWDSAVYFTEDPEFNPTIPFNSPAGDWQICVSAFSGCDTTEMVCIPVSISGIPSVTKEDTILCPEELPFAWGTVTVDGPGTFTSSFLDAGGCQVDSIWTIDVYPDVTPGVIDTTICDWQWTYEGHTYDAEGIYDLFYPGQSQFGCDSFAVLLLALHAIDFVVEVHDHEIVANVIDMSPAIEEITFSWQDCDGNFLGTGESIQVAESGCYCVTLSTGACDTTFCGMFLVDPGVDCDLADDRGCILRPIAFEFNGEPSGIIRYDWLIDTDQQGQTLHSNLPELIYTYVDTGTYTVTLTVTDSSGIFTCTDQIHIDEPLQASIGQFSDSLQAYPDTNATYRWYHCASSDTLSVESHYIAPETGCYCVEIIEANGCRDVRCEVITIVADESILATTIDIQPNPSAGAWQVSIPDAIDLPVKWSLFATNGVEIERGELALHTGTIVMDRPASGMYYLQLSNEAGLSSLHKLVVE